MSSHSATCWNEASMAGEGAAVRATHSSAPCFKVHRVVTQFYPPSCHLVYSFGSRPPGTFHSVLLFPRCDDLVSKTMMKTSRVSFIS